jgi:hypothetical protein
VPVFHRVRWEPTLGTPTATMKDITDAPECWKSESILVYGGEGREPIDIVHFLIDEQDEYASLMSVRKRLEFPADVYPPSWEHRKVIELAVKNAVAEADHINLTVYETAPNARYPRTTLACDKAHSYRAPKNANDRQANVYENREDLPRIDKPQDSVVHKRLANRKDGQSYPRRTYSEKRCTFTEKPPPDECCTFRIRISLDPGKCWYLPPWAGCRCHKFHAKLPQEEENETSRNQNQGLRAIAMESSDLYSSCMAVLGSLCEQARLSNDTTIESIIRKHLAEMQRAVNEKLLHRQGGQQESSEDVSSHVQVDGRTKSHRLKSASERKRKRSNGKGVRAPARLDEGSLVPSNT